MRRRSTLHRTTRSAAIDLPLARAWSIIASGARGPQWYVEAAPFRFRGALDRLLGGGGTRWAPPHHDLLRAGDRAGFWEVVEADHGAHRLVMEARVRAPGTVRMETTAAAGGAGNDSVTITQTISFAPSGIAGVAYLVTDLPARAVVSELTMLHVLTVLRRARP